MTEFVLDASAILAVLRKEPGADTVVPHLNSARVSTVNCAEVLAKALDAGIDVHTTQRIFDELGIERVPFDDRQAAVTARLRALTKTIGLSLGDRACLALATVANLPVLTCDRKWKDAGLKLDIRLVR